MAGMDLMAMGPSDTMPTIVELLRQRAAENPEKLFLQDVDGSTATYGEALAAAERWAGVAQALAIGHETTVASFGPNSVASTLLWLGLAMVRAWEAPVHPSYRGYMLENAVNNVGAETLFVHRDYLETVAASATRLATLRRVVVMGDDGDDATAASLPFEMLSGAELFAAATPAVDLPSPSPRDLAAIIYTSGTTGPSKGVMVPWGDIAAFVLRIWPIADLSEDDVIYGFTPSSHIGAKNLPYLAALLNGRLVIRPDFKIDRFLPDIREYGVTTTAVVGAIARFLEMQPRQSDDADIPLRNLVMAPAVPDLEGFKARFGVRVCTCYSMTELSGPIASAGWDVANWKSSGRLSPGWPWFEIRVVDDDDFDVGPGRLGELIVRTSAPWTLNLGYFGMPTETAHAWRNGWFHTGDGFVYDEAGEYYFVDRLKDTIRRRGENVSSFEVEAIANEHPAVVECAAVAVASDMTEDDILLYVVCQPEARLEPADLVAFLEPRMPRFMVPRYIDIVAELPKTMGSMRTQKAQLRDSGVSPTAWDRQPARQS
jgi:crotonobetaine/carnitine-CoA ligase